MHPPLRSFTQFLFGVQTPMPTPPTLPTLWAAAAAPEGGGRLARDPVRRTGRAPACERSPQAGLEPWVRLIYTAKFTLAV
jgi:hypothetical protein